MKMQRSMRVALSVALMALLALAAGVQAGM